MKLLEKQFESGMGAQNPPLIYKQICRKGQVAVYERSLENNIRDYEVILIRLAKAGDEIFNKVYDEDTEFYPGSSMWGKTGFSYYGIGGKEAAIKKFNCLIKEQENQINPAPKKEMIIPDGEFVTKDFARINNTNYFVANLYIKENLDKTIKFLRQERRNLKGKLSNIYSKL